MADGAAAPASAPVTVLDHAILWSRPPTVGSGGLAPRGGHSATLCGSLMVVFGGTATGTGGKFV
jgi:hypothetical protein